MILVISSPSSSTTGFATLILDISLLYPQPLMAAASALSRGAHGGSISATASTPAPNTANASTSKALRREDSRPDRRGGSTSLASPAASSEQPTRPAPQPAYFEPSEARSSPAATPASTIRYGIQASAPGESPGWLGWLSGLSSLCWLSSLCCLSSLCSLGPLGSLGRVARWPARVLGGSGV